MEEKQMQILELPERFNRGSSDSILSANSHLTEDSEGVSFEQHKGDKLWVLVSRASFTYAVLIILINISVQIAFIADVDAVTQRTLDEFKSCLYLIGVMGMFALIILGIQEKLSKNDHYRDRKKASFVRGGMLVLGSSAAMFRFISIYEYIVRPSWCRRPLDLFHAITGLVTTAMEMGFLFTFVKIRINRTRGVALFARALVMHMIATNVALWLHVVVYESLHEIESELDDGAGHFSGVSPYAKDLTQNDNETTTAKPTCPDFKMLNSLAPYLYPLIIEFAVVVTNMWLGVWENCGVGIIYQNPDDHLNDGHSSRRKSVATDGVPLEKLTGYENHNGGFIIGYFTLLLTLVLTMMYLFWLAGGMNIYTTHEANIVGYGVNVGLSAILLIAVIVATYRLYSLPTKSHDKKETGNTLRNKLTHLMDRRLLFGTGMALVIFKLNCLIAGAAKGEYLIVADSVISILASMGQTLFISAFALEKVCVTNYQRKVKPGRQSLELIRFTNLSLWFANTFILKSPTAKVIQYEVFGRVGWAAISNIFQPLTILHYFHAMVCVAEVVVDVYSDKHIYVMETFIEPASHPHPVSKLPVQGIPFDYVPSVSGSV